MSQPQTPRAKTITSARTGWSRSPVPIGAGTRTFTDNLSRLSGLAVEILDAADADAVTGRASEILELLAAAPKSLRWRTRNMLGRRVSWYELPEETRGAINARK